MTSLHDRAWVLQDRLASVVRRLPWWLVTAIGLGSLAAGMLLLAPQGSVDFRLRVMVGLGFILSGIDDLATGLGQGMRGLRWARVLTGCVAFVGGMIVLFGVVSHSGLISLAALIYLSSGASRIAAVVRHDSERPRTELAFGLLDTALALSCAFLPALGEIALSIVLGMRSVLVGCRIVLLSTTQLRRAQRSKRDPQLEPEAAERAPVTPAETAPPPREADE